MKRYFDVGQVYDFTDWRDNMVYRFTVKSVDRTGVRPVVFFDVNPPFVESSSLDPVSEIVRTVIYYNELVPSGHDGEFVILYEMDRSWAVIAADVMS